MQKVNYIIEFIKHFNKDTKYYLNIPFEYPEEKMNILEIYKDFARLNKGFVDSKTSDDIKLPNQLKTPDESGIQTIFNTITKDVVPNGNFEKLYTLKDYIL